MKDVLLALGIVMSVAFLSGDSSALGRRRGTNQDFSGWIVYWDRDKGENTLAAYGDSLKEITVFAYHFNDAGNIVAADPWVPEMVQALKNKALTTHQRILVTVVNDSISKTQHKLKDPEAVHRAISTPQARQKHIRDLLAACDPADGLEIDYENFSRDDRDNFSLFIQELAARLHEHGQWLSVITEPKTTDTGNHGASAIDWKRIGEFADQVKIMAYYFHYAGGDPGSITPLNWLSSVADYAKAQIPTEKISVALILQGLNWSKGKDTQRVDCLQAMDLLKRSGATLKRDRDKVPHFEYTDEQQRLHEVWFADAVSLEKQLNVLSRRGISHAAFWQMSLQNPEFWRSLDMEN